MKRFLALLCALLALLVAAPAWAAFGTVQNQGSMSIGSALNNQTFNTAADIASGDLVIFAIANQSSRTLSSLSGISCQAGSWNVTSNTLFTSNKRLTVAWCVAASAYAAGTTVTVNLSGTSIQTAVMQSVSGVDTTSPLDQAGTFSTATSAAPGYADAGAHTNAATIGFGASFVVDGETDTYNSDAAWSTRYTATAGSLGRVTLNNKVVASTTAVTRTDSNSASRIWASNNLWFKDGGGAPPATPHNLMLLGVGM